jgi:hypothetical protein
MHCSSQCCGSGSGIGCLFDTWIRDPGWEKVSIRIRDEQPGSYFLELRNQFFCFFGGLKYINSFMRIRDPGWRQFGSGIRDGKKSDPGSGINIPDPQHWFLHELCAVIRTSRGAYCTLSCTSGSKDFHPTPALDIPDFHSQTTPFADPKKMSYKSLQQKCDDCPEQKENMLDE